jgi:protein-S-isoprenylcysteine O-methyltransferase Ste14
MGVLALVLIAVWLLLVAGVRGYLQARRSGQMSIHRRDRPGSAQWWSRLIASVGLLAGVAAALADIAGLEPFGPLDNGVVVGLGIALVALGIAATIAAQWAMGDSWRGDVDPDVRSQLVMSGPFAIVRNPILTSTQVTVVGLALLVPNVLSALMLAAVIAAHQIQVRFVEEPYLLRVHGAAYRRYAASTGRFLPGIGRLRSSAQGEQSPAQGGQSRPDG